MPDKRTIEKARQEKREGKSPSTQAGEFVHEEVKHIREGKHGARSAKQAIAIGLAKARRAGVNLPARNAKDREDLKASRSRRKPSAARSRAATAKLKKEGRSAASHRALSRQARQAAR